MAIRVSYPMEIKWKAIEMRWRDVREVMEQLGIRNRTQLKVWMEWYRKGENRLEQPVGKQYSYNKGPEYTSGLEAIDVLKKYKELERR